jgi:alanine-glyoxylate transaminase / serine-glyoxylate transaminase / serine-pyruvate transaminase
VLVGVNGVFGTRMVEVAKRIGAEVNAVNADWGRALEAEQYRAAAGGRAHKLLCVVHAETSTGVLQPLAPLKQVADELGALLVVDTVTSLGGVPVALDELGIDAAYAGTQKCLSCPPGLSPISFSERACRVLETRKQPVQSWYLDLSLVRRYWGEDRVYHHTAPINMLYGLHEALRLVLEEGLEARFARHRLHHAALIAGLEALGFAPRVDSAIRLPPLTTIAIPHGLADQSGRRALLERFGLEIGAGLGPMLGNTWRIGLMGEGASRRHVELCLCALGSVLDRTRSGTDSGLAAAERVYSEAAGAR